MHAFLLVPREGAISALASRAASLGSAVPAPVALCSRLRLARMVPA